MLLPKLNAPLTTLFSLLFLCFFGSADAQSKLEVATSYLTENRANLSLSEKDLSAPKLSKEFTSRHNGVTHVYLIQTHNGITVHNAILNLNIKADEVLSVGNRFVSDLASRANASSPSIDALEALASASDHLNLSPCGDFHRVTAPSGAESEGLLSASCISHNDISCKLVYQLQPDKTVRLAWEFVIYQLDSKHWWQIRMDAADGSFLAKNDWIVECSHGKLSKDCASHASAGMAKVEGARNPFLPLTNSYNVYPVPVESPNHGGRELVNAPWTVYPAASPFGWHDTDGVAGAEYTITRGNNVLSQEDLDGLDGTGFSPDGGAGLDFDFPVDLTMEPATYTNAAITNLFYFNNMMHDITYAYGFDEPSGNFQENNYGNGALGADYVLADAQDGGGLNNANFGTPPDGQNPRMQMYLWNYPQAPLFEADGVPYLASGGGFGAQSGVWTGDLVLSNDGSASPQEGCSAIINDVAGKIAVIDRGNCAFVLKAQNAQDAGAIGVVIVNNTGGDPTNMGGTSATLTVPVVMISQAAGDILKTNMLSATVSATITLTGTGVAQDGDFDNGIIAHEYGHGISNRLTGGASTTGCLGNDEQMGEGWSDYFALMTSLEPGDLSTDVRGIGTYAVGQSVLGSGIRTYPYSTDFAVNPHTYANITSESVPHGVGSVWCAMLWDLTWALIDEYGFDPDMYQGTGGNNIAMQLVMDGLKLQPCSPGFADGRDAILMADLVNNGGVNQCLIWSVFANRGLGFSADQGSSHNVQDGTEAFDLPPLCTISIAKYGMAEVEAGTSMLYTVEVTNNSANAITGIEVEDFIPTEVTYVGGSASCAASFGAGILTLTIGELASGESMVCTYEVDVPAAPFSEIIAGSAIEDGGVDFDTSVGSGPLSWGLSTTKYRTSSTSWFAADPSEITDQYLDLDVSGPITANTELSFWHFYSTEADWDGCVLEASTDGLTWVDLGPNMIQNGYNSTITVNVSSAISGRPAFSGGSGGWIETIVDLSGYAGQTPTLRWRLASDAFVGGEGWYVDDIYVNDALITFENQACVSSDQFPTFCDEVATLVLETACTPLTWYADADEDAFGDLAFPLQHCLQPEGFVADNTDCNDLDSAMYPGAPGTGLDVDNNCNGVVEGDETSGTCLGDFNLDTMINTSDLLYLLGGFGCLEDCEGDLNGDDQTNTADILVLLGVFGTDCP